MPPAMPTVPGLEVSSLYHPVADGSRVGGDFFDVFSAGPGRWAIVMGAVCGQGVPAATLTAMARWTTRVAATQEDRPSDVLRKVNATVLAADIGERFCTLVLAFVEPRAGGAHVTLACGGHPLPFLVTGDKVTTVGAPGMVIGLFPDPNLDDAEVWLAPGDGLLLYTDGVTEARSVTGEFRSDLLPD